MRWLGLKLNTARTNGLSRFGDVGQARRSGQTTPYCDSFTGEPGVCRLLFVRSAFSAEGS